MNTPSSNSPGSSEPNYAAVIDNDVSRCQLLDVSKLPLPPDIKCLQCERGPYVVLQKGAMPGDLYSRPLDFLLTKEGRWLPMFAFVYLPEVERDELCIFSTAAEAIHQLERLAGRAMVDAKRIARARDAQLRSTPPKKLDPADGSSQSSTP
jgi:hypothetical protein